MSSKKTHEEYIAEVAIVNPNIEVVDKYINAKTKILHRCKIDGYEWFPSPSSVLSGRGCPSCRSRHISEILSKTHDEYVAELKIINPNIEVVEMYVNSETKILHRCKLDGYEWRVCPSSILQGVGCPMCSDKVPYTTESYTNKMNILHPTIEVVGEYKNNKTKVDLRCKIDGWEWSAYPKNSFKGQGCPKCGGRISITHEEYVDAVSMINKDLEVVGVFISKNTPILHRCKIDGYEWLVRPSHVLNGHGCPICNRSVGERIVANYLDEHCIYFTPQYTFDECKNKRKLPFDFYLNDINVCIEYDGIQHFKPVDIFGGDEYLQDVRNNDLIKTEYCFANNIPLLRIRYDEDIIRSLDGFLDSLTIQN